MHYLYSLFLGVVQGLTEFLPVSSSGHLVVLHEMLHLPTVSELAFDVSLHVGTLLALVVYFRIELLRYLAAVIEIFIPGRAVNRADLADVRLLIYASIPAALAGFLMQDFIEETLHSASVVVATLLIGSVLFFLVEKTAKHERDFTGLSIGQALYIGFAQALALIPGLSRSGITIVAGMSAKLKRTEAARFSFLLSIPAVFGAGVFEFFDVDWSGMTLPEINLFVIGIVSAFFVGLITIKYLLKFLAQHKLNVFAWYRIGLAVVIAVWFCWR